MDTYIHTYRAVYSRIDSEQLDGLVNNFFRRKIIILYFKFFKQIVRVNHRTFTCFGGTRIFSTDDGAGGCGHTVNIQRFSCVTKWQ